MLPLQVIILCKIICITINKRIWGIDYIAGQPTVAKIGKQIDTIKFLTYSRTTYSSELECHGSWGSGCSTVEYTVQYCDVKKYDTSKM